MAEGSRSVEENAETQNRGALARTGAAALKLHSESRPPDTLLLELRMVMARRRPIPPTRRTPPPWSGLRLRGGKASERSFTKREEMLFTSCRAAVCRWGSTPIRQKIIGRGTSLLARGLTCRSTFGLARTLALLDQPAREHCAGIFLEPLIQQRGNLLVQIGGVAETREFITLQRISGRREKKLPRRLGLGTGHEVLLNGLDAR